jgi:hypothetical protein
MNAIVRSIASIITVLVGIAFLVFVLNVTPGDLTPLLFGLTGAAFVSLIVLGHAALQQPYIDALTERTFIALIILALGVVSCLIVYNTDHGQVLFSAVTASLLFRLAILGVLAVPAIWLGLYAFGRLGRSGKG